ncbi:hypothetical protein DENSPDRAFT_842601 [Dentipellis sp. KUC8613]|nr:hypothetical protein DENSPDRAFT_842601 [Dentipellis sp. KUC8613]
MDQRGTVHTSSDEYWRDAERSRAAHLVEDGITDPHDFLVVRRAMEAELEAVERLPFLLRSRINTLSPVGRLPEEVLIHIILILHYIEPSGCRRYTYLHQRRFKILRIIGWIKITHVCRRWRNAALAYPRLWNSRVCSLGPNWMAEMLSRSGTAPVFITLTESMICPDEVADTLSALSQHLKHVQELAISAEEISWGLIGPSLSGETLSLEKCVLSGPVLRCGNELDLALGLFCQHKPRLRHLDMILLPVCWSFLDLPRLTFLQVINHPNKCVRMENSSYREFLDALGRMPMLETLILSHSMPDLPPTATLNSDEYLRTVAIDFPMLQKLRLIDDILACALLLGCMNVPGTATQTVDCSYGDFVQRPINLIFPWVKSRTDISSSIRKLSISDQDPCHSIHVCAFDKYDREDDCHFKTPWDLPIFDLIISHASSDSLSGLEQHLLPELQAWSVIQAMRTESVLPLEDLEVLSLTSVQDWDRIHWLDTFGDLDRVSVLHVANECSKYFCYAFCESGPSDYSQEFRNTETSILFPSLDTLIIEDVLLDFNGYRDYFAKTLLFFLEQRSRLPVRPLRRLKIGDNCGYDRDVLQTYRRIKKIVPSVEWDMCEGFTEEGTSQNGSEDESGEKHLKDEEGNKADSGDDEVNDDDDGVDEDGAEADGDDNVSDEDSSEEENKGYDDELGGTDKVEASVQ